MRAVNRCGNCGTSENVVTVVIDWRTEVLCDRCVARFDWSDWTFDPVLNTYTYPEWQGTS